jgi:hypothetical protein
MNIVRTWPGRSGRALIGLSVALAAVVLPLDNPAYGAQKVRSDDRSYYAVPPR